MITGLLIFGILLGSATSSGKPLYNRHMLPYRERNVIII